MSQSESQNRSGSTSPPDPGRQQEAHQVPSASTAQAEMAQAFKDLARGEQQAAAIETNLARLESKLDALLASIDTGGDLAEVNGTSANTTKEQPPEEKQE